MSENIYSMLVAEESSVFPEILKVILGNEDILMERVESPEQGMLALKRQRPYSLIWSQNKFSRSRTNGVQFLKYCNESSPLSARILHDHLTSKSVLTSMVTRGQIDSFYTGDLSLYTGQITPGVANLTASVRMGMEFHKLNLINHFTDGIDPQSIESLNGLLMTWKGLNQQSIFEKGQNKERSDFDFRNANTRKLFLSTQHSLNKLLNCMEGLNQFRSLEQALANEEILVLVGRIQKKINSMTSYLTASEQLLTKSNDHALRSEQQYQETRKKTIQLKNELLDQ
ncbi:MAG: hypothetical protein G3M78_12620 [Candidatus Nitrohelix vancouverensis]|uniref:Uncharacterized protein n=1 Tax=Candidatus Nitrohelix vancouverensis TaxID=2705534 RepID=A0A7T0C440_9BACT|nr:MAG: hypothetical protein G3M78_12620 [Candidatus Nitrohelix vancouverensis]